ncbi:MAG TPA: methyltransferase domain-containing protein, partial [Albitalea sp.]|nr:methyltransferase domain-containing protein [Albitalea sp.]
MQGPGVAFWEQRFAQGNIPWDRGAPGPQLAAWLAAGVLRAGDTVIVPGCGSGHEVVALAAAGCRVTALDYAPGAVEMTRQRLAHSGTHAELLRADVLQWKPEQPCDAVYEQTCLCALHPDQWVEYAARLRTWLRPDGLLCALFMQARRESGGQ